jgi:hypothetical protein
MRENTLEEKTPKTTKQKEKGEKPHMHEHEEHEGMPQHQNCNFAKRREDKNPKYHE